LFTVEVYDQFILLRFSGAVCVRACVCVRA